MINIEYFFKFHSSDLLHGECGQCTSINLNSTTIGYLPLSTKFCSNQNPVVVHIFVEALSIKYNWGQLLRCLFFKKKSDKLALIDNKSKHTSKITWRRLSPVQPRLCEAYLDLTSKINYHEHPFSIKSISFSEHAWIAHILLRGFSIDYDCIQLQCINKFILNFYKAKIH